MSLTPIRKHMDNGAIKLFFIFTIISLLFILVGHIYPKDIQAVLKQPITSVSATTFDLWSVSHLVLFAVLGYIFPYYLGELLVIGILWEIVEDALAPAQNTQLADCKNGDFSNPLKHFWCNVTSRNGDYWYAKWDDVSFDALGLIIGHWIRVNF